MKKLLYVAAIAAMSLTSCSNDDVLELKQDEIKFNVVANNASRAADVYCNNNLPNDFKVWAYYGQPGYQSMYFEEVVTKGEAGYNSANTRYWPNENYPLNFIATKNFDGQFTFNQLGGITHFDSFYVNPKVEDQVDLIYAITNNQTKSTAADGVVLNFRHALSQIVFNGKNTNPNIYVLVTGVKVGNIGSGGHPNFDITSETTDNYEDHSGASESEFTPCTWTGVGPEAGMTDYSVEWEFDPKNTPQWTSLALKNEVTPLTSTNATGKEFSNTAMLLIPQTRTAWDPETVETPNSEDNKGTFIAINCLIYNVANGDFNPTTDLPLHSGWAYIPVAIDWKAGKKYSYTFVFGNGNGGYDENGDPVLAPISYNLTVDDFQAVEEIEEEMKTKE